MTTKAVPDDSNVEVLTERVEELADRAKESGADAIAKIQDLIEMRPFESVGVALCAGYVLKLFTGPLFGAALMGGAAYLAWNGQTLSKPAARKSKRADHRR